MSFFEQLPRSLLLRVESGRFALRASSAVACLLLASHFAGCGGDSGGSTMLSDAGGASASNVSGATTAPAGSGGAAANATTSASTSSSASASTGPAASTTGSAAVTNSSGVTSDASTSTTGSAEGCPAGAVQCPDRCSNLMIDPYNCGACGAACAEGQACQNGGCTCSGTRVDCGSGCTSLDGDGQHCGACNNACPADQVCSQGVCGSGCLAQYTKCGQDCTDTNGSSQHCGACNNVCPADQLCKDGACGCSSTQSLCDGVCTSTEANNQHCGSCNNACQGAENCVDGFCLDPASLDCGGSATGNTCTNFEQDVYGKYYIFNNLWGADENNVSGSQCMWNNCLAGDLIGWGTSWDWPNTSGVKSYTSVVLGWHWGWIVPQAQTGLPVQLNSGTTVECGWSFDVNATGSFAVAYDLWTHTTPNPGNVAPSDEIMIWLYQSGAVGPIGSQQGSATIAGASWEVYRGQGGASWDVFSYVRSANTSTAVLNITDFTADLVARGWMDSNKYLVSIEAGPEVSGGSGEVNTRGFYCRNR